MRRFHLFGGLGVLSALAAFVLLPGVEAFNHVAMICGVGPGIQ